MRITSPVIFITMLLIFIILPTLLQTWFDVEPDRLSANKIDDQTLYYCFIVFSAIIFVLYGGENRIVSDNIIYNIYIINYVFYYKD